MKVRNQNRFAPHPHLMLLLLLHQYLPCCPSLFSIVWWWVGRRWFGGLATVTSCFVHFVFRSTATAVLFVVQPLHWSPPPPPPTDRPCAGLVPNCTSLATELKPVCVVVSRRPNLENIAPTNQLPPTTAYFWLTRHTRSVLIIIISTATH